MTNQPHDVPTRPGDADETGPLAAELGRAYRRLAAFYRDQLGLTGPEADARARGLELTSEDAAADLARLRARPPDQISWFDLSQLAERDSEVMAEVWGDIRRAARAELDSGHRAAQALDWDGRPWQRARFLAIRDSFRDSATPQSGIASALVDTAAETFGDYLEWSEHLHMQVSTEVTSERNSLERHGEWSPVRLSYAEAIEQAAKMAERSYKRFLQTVKLLHELQRSTPMLYVAHAEQVNVGQQQVNIARLTDGDDA